MLKEVFDMKNKKGQEGITLGTLLLIILGVVVVVVIIIGATQGFGFFFDKFGAAPGQSLETAVQSCGIAVSSNLRTDYCVNLKKVSIDGKEQYVSCSFLKDGNYLEDSLDCGSGDSKLKPNGNNYCVNQKLKDSMKVNGVGCGEIKKAATNSTNSTG